MTAAHPAYTKDHDTFQKAMDLLGKRHGKYELVGLVNWLLVERAKAESLLSFFHQERHARISVTACR